MFLKKIQTAIDFLKQGKIIIVVDDENREAEGDFVSIGELITSEVINFMATYGRGLICTPISRDIANKLELRPMVHNNTDPHGTSFTVTVDYKTSTTGISTSERATTIRYLAQDDSIATDFNKPGHVFPLIAKDGGVLVRAGHTEASIDLANFAGFKSVAVICEICNEDGSMMRYPQLMKLADTLNMPIITIQDLIQYKYFIDKTIVNLDSVVDMPTKNGCFELCSYSSIVDEQVQLVIKSKILDTTKPVLVRIHSECFTGDVLQSLRCDCNEQLNKALELIGEKNGIVIYLRQEGRGIGLRNKLQAYKLQEAGLDTVQANEALGFVNDSRHYGIAYAILKQLGISEINLITNNPEKIKSMEDFGVKVISRISIPSTANQHNKHYLMTKQTKNHHLLEINN